MDPLEGLKRLPWQPLIQAALLTITIVAFIEILGFFSAQQSSIIAGLFELFNQPLPALVVELLSALGFGVLGVFVFEKLFPAIRLRAGDLWALIVCLVMSIWLKLIFLELFLPGLLPYLPIQLSTSAFLGTIVGVFWKGRPYWNYRR
jgi:hypothetical protein